MAEEFKRFTVQVFLRRPENHSKVRHLKRRGWQIRSFSPGGFLGGTRVVMVRERSNRIDVPSKADRCRHTEVLTCSAGRRTTSTCTECGAVVRSTYE